MAIEMFKRGSVEMLALLILNEDDAHGYRIVQEIKDRSDGRLIIKEGSLFTQFCISCLTRAILFLRKIFLRLSLGVSVFALFILSHLKDENI